ncbi:MAG: hemerythrin domain-containing protein [Bryobacterales bacterium]|nr:hemerythrin domain-containing protein [Bryobacterales bacterium]
MVSRLDAWAFRPPRRPRRYTSGLQRHPSLIPLSHQHHNGLALCVMAFRGLESGASAANVRHWCTRAVERFDIELVNHFELEEQLVFPLLPGAMATRLAGEHRELERLAAALRHEPAREPLEAFLTLLRAHIRLEENEFFQLVQTGAPAAQLEAIGPEIGRRAVRVALT